MDFRKKLLVLAASGMAFAGLAFGASGDACGTPVNTPPTQFPPNLLRLEGTAELVTDLIIQCSGNTLAATTGQVIANLSGAGTLSITSKQVSSGPAVSEATLQINTGGTINLSTGVITGGTAVYYSGTVTGSSVSFGGPGAIGTPTGPVIFPATPYFIRVANIRASANTGAAGTYVAESLLATNQGVVIYATPGATNVGYIPSLGFATPTISGVNNYVICTGNPAKAPISTSFAVKLAENFGGAFKTQTGAGTCAALPCTETNGEQGSYQGGGGVGTANSGTLFQFAFAGTPNGAGVTTTPVIYLPVTATNGPLTLTLITSLTNTTPVSAAGSPIAGYAPITSANGAATAIYDVTATDNTVLGENVTVVGYVTANPGFATGAQAAITVTVTPAGTGSVNPTLIVPNFIVVQNPALTLSAFGVCQTSLLFPFVTAAQGFDTGIALANTSTDPFGTPATPGTCALNLYGTGAPTPSTGITTGPVANPVASGSVLTFQLGGSGVAAGFQGYMIVTCNFQYAHGYAFILAGSGTTAVAQGYLALTFNPTGAAPRGPATPEALNN